MIHCPPGMNIILICAVMLLKEIETELWLKIAAPSDLLLDVVRLINVLTYLLTLCLKPDCLFLTRLKSCWWLRRKREEEEEEVEGV